jgi:hypothetical protein
MWQEITIRAVISASEGCLDKLDSAGTATTVPDPHGFSSSAAACLPPR